MNTNSYSYTKESQIQTVRKLANGSTSQQQQHVNSSVLHQSKIYEDNNTIEIAQDNTPKQEKITSARGAGGSSSNGAHSSSNGDNTGSNSWVMRPFPLAQCFNSKVEEYISSKIVKGGI